MKTPEQIELENAALAYELSRQMAHDFSNFVYNLLLQIEIWEKSAEPQQLDWKPIKRESKKMASLLHQWERFHCRLLTEEPERVDLHGLIREVGSDVALGGRRVEWTPAISTEVFKIEGYSIPVKHLLRLILEGAFLACPDLTPVVFIQSAISNGKAVVRILAALSPDDAGGRTEDPDDERPSSLVEAACQSLAVRIDATIRREQRGENQSVVSLEFPLPSGSVFAS